MNARSVSFRARRKPGVTLTLATGLLLCSSCSAQQQPQASKIYVLSAGRGCKITTYTMDGKQIDPEIPIGGFTCNGMVMDAEGNLLVSIRDRGVMKFNSQDGKGKMFVGNAGASALAIDAKGNLHLLVARDTDNWVVYTLGRGGVAFADYVRIKLPYVSGIALNQAGRLFALSQGSSIVRMFEPDGRLLVQTIGTGNTPRAITVGPDGRIFIANYLSVTSFSAEGKPLWAPLKHVDPASQGVDTPTALTVDPQGWLYIGYSDGWVGAISPEGKPKGDAFMAREDIRGIAVR